MSEFDADILLVRRVAKSILSLLEKYTKIHESEFYKEHEFSPFDMQISINFNAEFDDGWSLEFIDARTEERFSIYDTEWANDYYLECHTAGKKCHSKYMYFKVDIMECMLHHIKTEDIKKALKKILKLKAHQNKAVWPDSVDSEKGKTIDAIMGL